MLTFSEHPGESGDHGEEKESCHEAADEGNVRPPNSDQEREFGDEQRNTGVAVDSSAYGKSSLGKGEQKDGARNTHKADEAPYERQNADRRVHFDRFYLHSVGLFFHEHGEIS